MAICRLSFMKAQCSVDQLQTGICTATRPLYTPMRADAIGHNIHVNITTRNGGLVVLTTVYKLLLFCHHRGIKAKSIDSSWHYVITRGTFQHKRTAERIDTVTRKWQIDMASQCLLRYHNRHPDKSGLGLRQWKIQFLGITLVPSLSYGPENFVSIFFQLKKMVIYAPSCFLWTYVHISIECENTLRTHALKWREPKRIWKNLERWSVNIAI